MRGRGYPKAAAALWQGNKDIRQERCSGVIKLAWPEPTVQFSVSGAHVQQGRSSSNAMDLQGRMASEFQLSALFLVEDKAVKCSYKVVSRQFSCIQCSFNLESVLFQGKNFYLSDYDIFILFLTALIFHFSYRN